MKIMNTNKSTEYVLVVGDELIDRKGLTETLNRAGYYVLFAQNALNALRILTESRPIMVVIGFVTGRPDRQTFTRILKNDQNTSEIRVVAISEDEISLAGLMPIGFDGFITIRDRGQDIASEIKRILFNNNNQ